MRASAFYTTKDELAGYPETRKALGEESTERLLKEYGDGMRDCFNSMFGGNARRFHNLVAQELLNRGVTHVPNFFGDIAIKTWTY